MDSVCTPCHPLPQLGGWPQICDIREGERAGGRMWCITVSHCHADSSFTPVTRLAIPRYDSSQLRRERQLPIPNVILVPARCARPPMAPIIVNIVLIKTMRYIVHYISSYCIIGDSSYTGCNTIQNCVISKTKLWLEKHLCVTPWGR